MKNQFNVQIAILTLCFGSCWAQESGLSDGFILIAPMGSPTAHLVNADKKIVHTWDVGEGPGNATYLEKDGSLLRTAKLTDNSHFQARGGGGGIIRRFSWDGELTWEYRVSDDRLHHHHDIEPMPNGNVLVIAWERHTRDEAIEAGRNPDTISGDAIWTETILELKPVGKDDAEVVWKWRLWDHLIQAFDETKGNFGDVAAHPELVDFNYGIRRGGADWIHMNSVAYNAELDQIALSARWFNECWIIDHSTTAEEAAGRKGDLLYRWGNPEAYKAGSPSDRQFFLQHDVDWIEAGPGAGDLLLFNNGDRDAQRNYSSADQFTPPLNADGGYELGPDIAFGPKKLKWSYNAPNDGFLSNRISGAQQLPNGNTLICSGEQGWVFEVTPDGDRIWEMRVASLLGQGPATTAAPKGKDKGKGKGGKGGGGRGAVFRAPWYPADFSAVFEKLN